MAFELRHAAARNDEVIRDKAIRNGRGVILHNVDLPHVYVDTVYYSAPVLAKLGRALDRDDWRGDAMSQLRMHPRARGRGSSASAARSPTRSGCAPSASTRVRASASSPIVVASCSTCAARAWRSTTPSPPPSPRSRSRRADA
jgi:hypothetical protein